MVNLQLKGLILLPSNKLVESLPGIETRVSYQLGSLAVSESKKREPAQLVNEILLP